MAADIDVRILRSDPFEERLVLKYTLFHNEIPVPQIGWTGSWRERHAAIPDLLADHRSCPSVGRREGLGITLRMPYTARFSRDGSVEVTQLWGAADRQTIRYEPLQGKSQILGKRRKAFVDFPASLIYLPVPSWRQGRLGLFLLGDLRLNTWIIDSGVFIRDLPTGYTAFITPLPNTDYPETHSVSQGMAESLPRFMGHLKIPVDLHFDRLASQDEVITLERGTPMVQWTIVRVPKVRLESIGEVGGRGEDAGYNSWRVGPEYVEEVISQLSDDTHADAQELRFRRGFYYMSFVVGGSTRDLLAAMVKRWAEAGQALVVEGGEAREALRPLIAAGIVYPTSTRWEKDLNNEQLYPARQDSWRLLTRRQAWNEVYDTGRHHRWNLREPSVELRGIVNALGTALYDTKCIDIGAGGTIEASYLAAAGAHVSALDIADAAFDGSAPSSAGSRPVECLIQDICGQPLDLRGYQLALDRCCFPYIHSDSARRRYVSNVAALLKPGGLLFLRGIYSEDADPRYLLPTQPNYVCNYVAPLNENVLGDFFSGAFRILWTALFPLCTSQIETQGIAMLAVVAGCSERSSWRVSPAVLSVN